MSFNKQQAIDILHYWYQTEFFNCIDLKELRNDGNGVIHYDMDKLANNPNILPWLKRKNIQRAGKGYDPNSQYSYIIYIGVFKSCNYFEKARNCLVRKRDEGWEERTVDGGLTCAATIKLSEDGLVLLDTIELSTAPWALGQVLRGNIDTIRYDYFEKESEQLIQKLYSLEKLASNLKQRFGISDALTTFEIIEFLKIINDWTGCEMLLHTGPVVIVKLMALRRDDSTELPKLENNIVTPKAIMQLQRLQNGLIAYEETAGADDETCYRNQGMDNAKKEDNVSILNSFFLSDLERARKLIKDCKLHEESPLIKYLSATNKPKADLLSPDGELLIRNSVTLQNTPLGRWPSDSRHSMSLMQQFAINTIDKELRCQGIFSVNGPPGTGKTTMLRDLVANNIVKRARVLSQLDGSHSAFNDDISIKVGDKIIDGVKRLKPELTGYEMAVVSNNNSAVENISKELPQLKAIGSEFTDIDYLKPVAQKLAAKHDNDKNIYSLTDEEDCWGLVAASLGNSANRNKFSQRTHFSIMKYLTPKNGSAAKHYSTLVPAIKKIINSCSDTESHFQMSQKEFIQAESHVKECIQEINCLETLTEVLPKVEKEKVEIENEINSIKGYALHTEYCLSKIKLKKVTVLSIRKWLKRISLLKAFKLRLKIRLMKIKMLETKLEKLSVSIQRDKKMYTILCEKHKGVIFSCNTENLESKETQRSTFGHSLLLNKVRSELSIKAFNLHQAWLVASYKKCFSKNVNIFNDVLMGNIRDYEHAKIVWQSFFMVIPVVSSAFASVANQSSRLHEGDIGWLFIDEAGQATPQQAVGAILRSKRVVVVGDPLQVEPVFTIPPEFVETLGRKMLGEEWKKWSPTICSVQTVSDSVNPYGTKFISDTLWMGSPLRVHRRCKYPMFTIANKIAYNEKMIHGSDNIIEQDEIVWGESCWFDVSGTEEKHYVTEQGEFVLELLRQYVDYHHTLPDCYIISPFKGVKEKLIEFLEMNSDCFKDGEEKYGFNFNYWLTGRIGTVHTFQGKEEKIVLFILGASLDTKGAAVWASIKPNLLNVAVTRAKNRIYIIGCTKVWGASGCFSDAYEILPVKNAPLLYSMA